MLKENLINQSKEVAFEESKDKNSSESSESDDTNNPEVRFLSVDEAIEEAGGFGRFQFLYVPLAGIGFIANGFFIYNLNYLTLLPELMCPDGDGGQRPWIDEAAHRRDNFWTSDGKLEDFVTINGESYKTIINWMSDMNMYWSSSFEVSLFWIYIFLWCIVLSNWFKICKYLWQKAGINFWVNLKLSHISCFSFYK